MHRKFWKSFVSVNLLLTALFSNLAIAGDRWITANPDKIKYKLEKETGSTSSGWNSMSHVIVLKINDEEARVNIGYGLYSPSDIEKRIAKITISDQNYQFPATILHVKYYDDLVDLLDLAEARAAAKDKGLFDKDPCNSPRKSQKEREECLSIHQAEDKIVKPDPNSAGKFCKSPDWQAAQEKYKEYRNAQALDYDTTEAMDFVKTYFWNTEQGNPETKFSQQYREERLKIFPANNTPTEIIRSLDAATNLSYPSIEDINKDKGVWRSALTNAELKYLKKGVEALKSQWFGKLVTLCSPSKTSGAKQSVKQKSPGGKSNTGSK